MLWMRTLEQLLREKLGSGAQRAAARHVPQACL